MPGIFPLDEPAGQRTVRDWYGLTNIARDTIEGPLPGNSTPVSAVNVADVVFRALNAVKFAVTRGDATGAQQTATIALFNAVWFPSIPAVTINDCIQRSDDAVATVSAGGVLSLFVQTNLWIDGMFLA